MNNSVNFFEFFDMLTFSTIQSVLASAYKRLSAQERLASNTLYLELMRDLKNNRLLRARQKLEEPFNCPTSLKVELISLLDTLLTAEDCADSESAILISAHSPFKESLEALAKRRNLIVVDHTASQGRWTKDYMISYQHGVFFPASPKTSHCYAKEAAIAGADSPHLYYGPLEIKEHHLAKTSVSNIGKWHKETKPVLRTTMPASNIKIEGGNCFNAINKDGERYFIIGENVVSETMAFQKISRQAAISLISKEFLINKKNLLVLPQWAYHLDLQMSYLGGAQFIIHSFEQTSFDFDLTDEDKAHCQKTFRFMQKNFEDKVVNAICATLREHNFDVKKVFGALFFLTDIKDNAQLSYIPYCKHDDGFSGSVAFLMNGFAAKDDANEYIFVTTECDDAKFRTQFEASLAEIGRQVEYINVPEFLDPEYSEFSGIQAGVWGATKLSDYIAFQNGGLRCQTSIVNFNFLNPEQQSSCIIQHAINATPDF